MFYISRNIFSQHEIPFALSRFNFSRISASAVTCTASFSATSLISPIISTPSSFPFTSLLPNLFLASVLSRFICSHCWSRASAFLSLISFANMVANLLALEATPRARVSNPVSAWSGVRSSGRTAPAASSWIRSLSWLGRLQNCSNWMSPSIGPSVLCGLADL